MFSYWRWTAEVDLHHHSCHRSLLSSDCSHFSNYRIWNASGKSGTRVEGKSTTISTNGLAPKKKHTAGGSNLMSETEHLLASRSNWYEIDSTPQNQYPGVFPPQNPDSPSLGLKRMGHIVDCSKLPQFTEGNPHLFITKTSSQKVPTMTMSEKLLLMATSRTFAFTMQHVMVCSSVTPTTAPLRAQKKPKNVRLILCHS